MKYGKLGYAFFYKNPVYAGTRLVFAKVDQMAAFIINDAWRNVSRLRCPRQLTGRTAMTQQAFHLLSLSLKPEHHAELQAMTDGIDAFAQAAPERR